MDFPFALTGSVRTPVAEPSPAMAEALAEDIAEALWGLGPKRVWREQADVMFTTGVFRLVLDFNLLIMFASGVIRVTSTAEELVVSYRLQTIRALIFFLAAIGLFMAAAWNFGNDQLRLAGLTLGVTAILFGVRYIIDEVRFRRWIERRVRRHLLSDRLPEMYV